MSGPTPSAAASLLKSQLFFHPPLPTSTFEGQTVIITGANGGLGREAAKHIVQLSAAKVILAVRTPSKGEEAVRYIERQTGRKGVIEVWELDMANFASVQAFAKRADGLERVDALVENAGVWPSTFSWAEGHESTLTVNVLSTILLAQLLLPKLHKTADQFQTTTRITFVTSALHAFAKFPARKSPAIISALNDPGLKDFGNRYNDSKLLIHLYGAKFARDIADRNGSAICLNFVAPGWCRSNLKHQAGERLLARSADEGARCIVDAVALDKASGRHGAYIDDMRVKRPAAWLETPEGKETAERVWSEINETLRPWLLG